MKKITCLRCEGEGWVLPIHGEWGDCIISYADKCPICKGAKEIEVEENEIYIYRDRISTVFSE